MFFKILYGDFKKSKMITLLTVLFVAIAATLISLLAILVINLTGSIDNLMTKAKTPHFMQMHSGTIYENGLITFVKNNDYIEDFQILSFLNIEGIQITIGDHSFRDSMQDNGLCAQSPSFDYLLDFDNNIIEPSDGELYVPIVYMKENMAKLGNKAIICGKKFTVAGFLRDSQMNSLLSSSKRFLVSKNDFEALKAFGEIEYLIEFRLKTLESLSTFTNQYSESGLEANGPTITYPLFRLINAISDGLMIAVILLVSFLVVIIAFMCIRFTLLAKIEDEIREIGVMKAIGIHLSNIQWIYMIKYIAISAIGCTLGLFISFIVKDMLLENIRVYMGENENTVYAFVFGLLGVIIVFVTIIWYVWLMMKRFKKISAVEALRFGASHEKVKAINIFKLNKNSLFNANIFYGLKDVLIRKKLYITMFMVFIFSVFIILVPTNMYNTISASSFITYMGVGECDFSINIQQTDNISEKADTIITQMKGDIAIDKCVNLTTKTFTAMSDDTKISLKVELGNHGVLPVAYINGNAPTSENEIALSSLNASELHKKVQDILTLIVDGREKNLVVCGIYSDITNGGKTAKACFNDNSKDIMWSAIYASVVNKSIIDNKVSEYAMQYPFAKVLSIKSYANQTIGPTISTVKMASQASVVVALSITALITSLFMIMLVTKDKNTIAIMKALGFTKYDLTLQYITRSGFVLVIGIIIGSILANTLGELLSGTIIASLGATTFHFIIDPFTSYGLYPMLMACIALIATLIGTTGIDKVKIFENIKE